MVNRFIIGIVGSPFGLDGLVKVKSLSGEAAHFSKLKKVTLEKGAKEEIREVLEVILRGNSLLMRFSGIENLNDASSLTGSGIIAGREYASPLGEGQFYAEDLKGLEVFDTKEIKIGFIFDILEGGGGDLAEIELPSSKRRMVPFRNEFLGDPDFENRRITLLASWILDET